MNNYGRTLSADPATVAASPPYRLSGGRLRAVQVSVVVFLLGVAATVGFVIYEMITTQGQALVLSRPVMLVPAVLLLLGPSFTRAIRIRLWGTVFGHTLSLRQAISAVAINDVAGAITPTAMGGGYAKLYYLTRQGFSGAQATLTMLLGSIEDSVFLVIMLAAVWYDTTSDGHGAVRAALLEAGGSLVLLLAVILAVALIAFVFRKSITRAMAPRVERAQSRGLSWKERARKFLREIWQAIRFVQRNGRGTFLITASLSCLGWAARYASIIFIFHAFDLAVEPIAATILHWGAFTITNFVATPGGMGGAEASFAVLFSSVIPADLLPMVTVWWRILTFYLLILIGALILLIVQRSFSRSLFSFTNRTA